MTLPELKQKILDKTYSQQMLIFKYEDTDFIPRQYIDAICDILDSSVEFIDNLMSLPRGNVFLSDSITYVYKCESIDSLVEKHNNLIIIARKVSNSILKDFADCVVLVPPLEAWMVEDYVKSICSGLSDSAVKWSVTTYHSNPYKIKLELDKLTLFPESIRKMLFETFKEEHVFAPSGDEEILNLSAAIQGRDMEAIKKILADPTKIEIDPLPTLFLVQGNFKKLMKVWLNKNPNPDNTGLKSNQVWVINKLPRTYTREQMLKIFEILSGLDNRIKEGEFPIEYLVDYMLIKILK